MRRYLHVVVGLLFVLALGFDLYLWGGLSQAPTLGRVVAEATSRELALASVYAPTGAGLLEASGLGASAARYAEETFAPIQAKVLANPSAAMETLVLDMPMTPRIAYYGAPILLVAFALAWWRRPRMLRSMGRR